MRLEENQGQAGWGSGSIHRLRIPTKAELFGLGVIPIIPVTLNYKGKSGHAIRPSPWKVFLLEWVYGAVTAMAKSGSPRDYRFAAERTCAVMVPSIYAALDEVVPRGRPR